MGTDEAMVLASILPIFIFWGFFGILFAIGNYFLAMRLGTNKFLWVLLSIIPIINFFFIYYVIYKTIYAVLDRLDNR
tara:strand:- start:74 stop:304 length:231 start_codon:yes stop_codon:yes gene_type:complete